jgi:hypothetical protein
MYAHQSHVEYVGAQGQRRHVDDRASDLLHIKRRLGLDRSVRLGHAVCSATAHRRCGISYNISQSAHVFKTVYRRLTNIKLTGGNVVFPAVETRTFGQSGNGVFADCVRGGVCEVSA